MCDSTKVIRKCGNCEYMWLKTDTTGNCSVNNFEEKLINDTCNEHKIGDPIINTILGKENSPPFLNPFL